MRRCIFAVIAALLFLMPGAGAKVHTVEYYFLSYCESCDPTEEFSAQFKALTGMDLEDCDFSAHNTATASGRAALDAAMARYSLSEEVLPMAVVDGKVYRGANELNEKLPPEALNWGGGTVSQVVYLYTPACESCAQAEAALKALPLSVTVKRGALSFESEVHVARYDATKHADLAEALFDAYAVPESRRVTPSVFLPGRALTGIEEIESNLSSWVSLGWAVGEVSAAPSEEDAKTWGLWGSLASGLLAGFNGCALSMLLMFLSLVISLRENAWPAVAAFLLAKLACCVAIGSLLLGVLQALNPTWLAPALRILLTATTGILALFTLRDAWYARKGDLGRMKNQLPAGLRGRLHRAMRALTAKKFLIPASIALGFLVAAGEFLCAGQLYLARLIGSNGWTGNERLMHLLAYCLGFIAPSAAIAGAILTGRSTAAVSAALTRHIALIKLLTAVAMLVLVALAWVI